MCGIAGIHRFDKNLVNKEVLEEMGGKLAHRGPDGSGIYVDQHMGLVHRRLKIIDLSDKAHQPMTYGGGRFVICYNGEVYNYLELKKELEEEGFSFESNSDTEVILASYARWGVGCVRKFNGMFAFAIWDSREKKLFCARDRLGVKPFYYHCSSKRFAFASEIKSLLSLRDVLVKPNHKVMRDFLVLGILNHSSETFFEGICELKPAHILIIDRRGLRKESYWEIEVSDKLDENGMVAIEAEKFRNLLTDAIRIRLRSDVPVGSCLSGGIDSTSIVCLIYALSSCNQKALSGEHLKTFSAVSEIPYLDERSYIRLVNASTNAEAHFVFPEIIDFIEELDKLIWHQEEPFSNASVYAQWCVFRSAAKAGIKVVLDGQGADEQLCGYRKFSYFFLRELISRGEILCFLKEICNSPANFNFFKGVDFRHSLRYFRGWQRYGGLSKIVRPEAFFSAQKENVIGWAGSLAQRILLDMTRYSLPSLLRYEDKNSMAFSIESRTPFLDYRLVEFLARLPLRLKIRNGWNKFILRDAMKGIIPEEIRWRRAKLAFDVPQDVWLQNGLREAVKEAFSSKGLLASILFTERLCLEFDAFGSGRSSISGNFFFRAFILERWSQRFSVKG